jgi:hypothetical protein
MLDWLPSIGNVISAGRKPDRFDTATRIRWTRISATGARPWAERERFRKVDQIEELRRTLGDQSGTR